MLVCVSQSREDCPCYCLGWHRGFWVRGGKCIPGLPRKSHSPPWYTHTHTHTILVGYCGTVWLQLKTEGRGLSLSLRSDWNCSLAVLLLADRMKQDILSGTGLPVENVCFDKMKYTLGLIQNTWKEGMSLVSYISHVLRSCMRQPLTFLQLYVCEGCFSNQLGLF